MVGIRLRLGIGVTPDVEGGGVDCGVVGALLIGDSTGEGFDSCSSTFTIEWRSS